MIYLFLVTFLIPDLAFSQDSTFVYNINIQGSASTASTPFWLHANTNASVPLEGSFVSGQIGLYKKYNIHNPRILQWSAGAEMITYAGKKNDAFFSDLYIAAKLGPIELSIGQSGYRYGQPLQSRGRYWHWLPHQV